MAELTVMLLETCAAMGISADVLSWLGKGDGRGEGGGGGDVH